MRTRIAKLVAGSFAVCATIGVGARTPCYAQEPSIFRDDFEATGLDEEWILVRQDAVHYSTDARPGFFRVLTQRGILGDEGTARNLLLRPASGNFVIETRLEFDPRAGQQFAGLLVYEDDAHAVAAGLIRISGIRGVFRGAIVLNEGGEDPSGTTPPAARYDDTNVPTPSVIYLRMLRQGDQFVAGYSEDGLLYRDLGAVINDMPDTVLVGIGAANGDGATCGSGCDLSIPADFDYFELRAVDATDSGPPPVEVQLDRVKIVGPSAVMIGSDRQFQAIAEFTDGSDRLVTNHAEWAMGPPDRGTIVGGVLSAANLVNAAQITVVAKYAQLTSGGSVTKYGTKVVRIETDPRAVPGIPMCGGSIAGVVSVMLLTLFFARTSRRRHHASESRRFTRGG